MDVLKPFSRFFREQKGITSLEYGLIVVAMGVALMFILYGEKGITEVIKDKFNEFSDIIMNAIVRV
ncbi:Flp family type IVb pilin [Glaesserella sp.]|uniref:Flp family type IVb pilin n=1 Tax=Glaesserella sp. TaxID=2094731 RepID=UPI00359FAD7A